MKTLHRARRMCFTNQTSADRKRLKRILKGLILETFDLTLVETFPNYIFYFRASAVQYDPTHQKLKVRTILK